MPRIQVPMIGGATPSRTIQVNPQRTVNLYPVFQSPNAKLPIILESTPGLTRIGAAGVGPARSLRGDVFNDEAYVVSGNQVLSVTPGNVVTERGILSTNTGTVSMAAGRDYIMFVDGQFGYTWDGDEEADPTTFGQITDPDFPSNPTHVTYLDGYFIVNNAGSDQVQISALEDPTSWNALDFTSSAANPDDVLAIDSTHRDLYLIGERTTEVYYNSGNPDFPFDIYPNGVLEWGTIAPQSIARAGGILFWLARTSDGGVGVVRVDGFTGQSILDPDISWAIEQLTVVTDAIGWTYRQADQTFYVLTFPNDDKTFAYNIEQNVWHERRSKGLGRWRAHGNVYLNNRHITGDYRNGNIYLLDFDDYQENGNTIERIRTTLMIHRDRRRLQVDSFEIEFAAGVGLQTGQGDDPQAMLRYSKDGGKTYSNELWRDIGKVGEYKNRCVWNQLGVAREFTFEVVVTDPVPVTIIGAYADVQVLGT